MLSGDKLFAPAADWTGQTWIERIDQCASMLFVHGYIPLSARERIAKRLEKDGLAALASVDTHPKGGDPAQTGAPFMSGAVREAETPK